MHEPGACLVERQTNVSIGRLHLDQAGELARVLARAGWIENAVKRELHVFGCQRPIVLVEGHTAASLKV